MSKLHRKSTHRLQVSRDRHSGEVRWTGISEWDGPRGLGSRLRNTMARRTWLWTEADARKWAKRWKVEFKPAPPPPADLTLSPPAVIIKVEGETT